jgi:hypothetical protein
LIAEKDHAVFVVRVFDFSEAVGVQRLRKSTPRISAPKAAQAGMFCMLIGTGLD